MCDVVAILSVRACVVLETRIFYFYFFVWLCVMLSLAVPNEIVRVVFFRFPSQLHGRV